MVLQLSNKVSHGMDILITLRIYKLLHDATQPVRQNGLKKLLTSLSGTHNPLPIGGRNVSVKKLVDQSPVTYT